jgi:hypothetical protein
VASSKLRNARGTISVPATNSIANRNTTDYSFNVGVNPTIHLGTNVITFNNGVQATVRRDSETPVQLDQNLFRLFTYMSTSSFFNAVSMDGYVLRETGPFTETNMHSAAFAAAVNFRVGAPWGKTALVTGWGENDQKFTPVSIEDLLHLVLHRAGSPLRRAGRRQNHPGGPACVANGGDALGDLPGTSPRRDGSVHPARNWSVQASAAYSNTRGFHIYDAVQSGFTVSYGIPFHREFRDETGDVVLQYPIRFSAGVQQETFFNFTGGQNQQFRPYISITLF